MYRPTRYRALKFSNSPATLKAVWFYEDWLSLMSEKKGNWEDVKDPCFYEAPPHQVARDPGSPPFLTAITSSLIYLFTFRDDSRTLYSPFFSPFLYFHLSKIRMTVNKYDNKLWFSPDEERQSTFSRFLIKTLYSEKNSHPGHF